MRDAATETREALEREQGRRLTRLLAHLDGRSPFYTAKLRSAGIEPAALDLPADLGRLPFTTKAELVADQQAHPPFGSVLSEPLASYTRYHQTSSTTGRPLRWLDTNASWQWALDCWKAVYGGARVTAADHIFFPFSFGPFLGFWTAFDAGCQIGAQCIPGGGMSSHQRLALIELVSATVVCCTPTYALRLAEVAEAEHGADRPAGGGRVRVLIVAGEPGGSLSAVRERIEQRWQARVIDHYGLTEVGPAAYECWDAPGFLHVNEDEFIAEVVDPAGDAVEEGTLGELVLTNLGRAACPVIRYRTGDVVRRTLAPCPCGRASARLEGGVLARRDDMVTIRGVNVFPTAVESVVRQFAAIAEFRATVSRAGALRQLSLEIELGPDAGAQGEPVAAALAVALRDSLGLTVPVAVVAPGSLPRFELKARRFVVER